MRQKQFKLQFRSGYRNWRGMYITSDGLEFTATLPMTKPIALMWLCVARAGAFYLAA